MGRETPILERKVIHPGKPFIKAGEEHARAYVVQNGLIRSYIMDGDKRIDVAEYEPGRIIGETCLMVDEPMTMNYEAIVDTTVVTVTRQDFQKKIARIDKEIMTILDHVMNKLNYMDLTAIDKARERERLDEDAFKMVSVLTVGMPEEKKFQYEKAILPHANQMIKAIKQLKMDTPKPNDAGQVADAIAEETTNTNPALEEAADPA